VKVGTVEKGVSMHKRSKVLQKIYRGLIGGTCAALLVGIFGILWHSFLGHSHGFGFFSFNVLGWILLFVFAVIVGCIKGVIIGLVDLLEKSWLTLICSLILWAVRPSIEAFHAINRTRHALYLDTGYAVLSILAAILCTAIVVKQSGVVPKN
jgi:hypothetical protein